MALVHSITLAVSNFSALFPIYTGRKQRNLLWYYCIFSFGTDISQLILDRLFIKSYWMNNLFLALEFLLVAIYLNRQIFVASGRLINNLIIAILFSYFVISTSLTSWLSVNLAAASLLYAYFMIILMIGMQKLMKDMKHEYIQKSATFIFYVGFFLYTTGASIIFLFDRYLISTNKAFSDQLWDVILILNILKNFAIGYSFILSKKEKWPLSQQVNH